MIYTCTIHTPLGAMTAAATDAAISGLWFNGQKYYPAQTAGWTESPQHPLFTALRAYLTDYFSGSSQPHNLPLAPAGSEFRQQVWQLLLAISHGTVTTYGRLAADMAAQRGLAAMSAQAVGGAIGHNPLTILIPCHRVIGAAGALTGYAGGLEKKQALLRLEGVAVPG
ncbi:MAG: methylated-DNA--[protein]-cysteine S-methyltransferase [Sporomusaceae bacterium]|nr:methylated-DNA--[protein]-cysteine S-methyltransferase [Sporomusaceae bacterium]